MPARLRSLLLALAATVGVVATAGAAPAAAACSPASKEPGVKVSIWEPPDCTGFPANLAATGEDDVPDFTKFPHTARVANVDNNRSSFAVAQGYCVRFFDFKNYGGENSSLFCGAVTQPAAYKLGSLNDRASSMRTCPENARTLCDARLPPPPPQPPQPPPVGTGGTTPGGDTTGSGPEDDPMSEPSGLPSVPTDKLRFDAAGRKCLKRSTEGARALRAWMVETEIARRGTPKIYRCGKRRDLHSAGRAVDFPARSQDAAEQLIKLLLADEYALARSMGVQEIIYDGTFWTANAPSTVMRRYRGKAPHRRSVHVGLNKLGAAMTTSFWAEGGGASPSGGGSSSSPSGGDGSSSSAPPPGGCGGGGPASGGDGPCSGGGTSDGGLDEKGDYKPPR